MALDPQHSLARDSDHLATAERIHHGQHGEGCDACALAAEVARLIEQRDVLELDRVRLAVEVHRLREGLERIASDDGGMIRTNPSLTGSGRSCRYCNCIALPLTWCPVQIARSLLAPGEDK